MLVAAALMLVLTASGGENPNPMNHRANGTFDIKIEPMASTTFSRMSSVKQYHGDLEGTSHGEMMGIQNNEGSGAYAALEVVTGTVHGKKGSFTLVHSGTMRRHGEFSMIIRVVPESGTDELAGITGTMEIVIESGKHFYHFDYSL